MQVHNAPSILPRPQYKGAPAERLFAQVKADDGNIAQLLFLHIFCIDRQVRHARRLAVRDKLRKGGAHGKTTAALRRQAKVALARMHRDPEAGG